MVDRGELIAERWRDILNGDRIHIIRADPQAMITAELVDQIRSPNHHPDVSLDGDVLTINADNGRWVYRIGKYDPQLDAYRMEWPD